MAHAASSGSLREIKMNYEAMLKTAADMSVTVPTLQDLGIYFQEIKN
jgi:uncharacterized protein YukE